MVESVFDRLDASKYSNPQDEYSDRSIADGSYAGEDDVPAVAMSFEKASPWGSQYGHTDENWDYD